LWRHAEQLYAKCVELGLWLFVYVGMPGPLWPMMPNDPTVLDEVALAFPDLKIIAHHGGDPGMTSWSGWRHTLSHCI
jgi:predicted TIM-barrel fold metal-dependent hydrolase